MEKLVSIIVPVYNTEKYIEQCIQSILNNGYSNIEILAINDGSTDNSGAILELLSRSDCRVKVINKVNEGVSVARNLGLDLSLGEYITFVDSDDYIKRGMIQDLVSRLEKNDCDIAVCTRCRVCDNIEIDEKINYFENIIDVSELDISKTNTIYDWSVTWGKLYKRELIGATRFPCEIK